MSPSRSSGGTGAAQGEKPPFLGSTTSADASAEEEKLRRIQGEAGQGRPPSVSPSRSRFVESKRGTKKALGVARTSSPSLAAKILHQPQALFDVLGTSGSKNWNPRQVTMSNQQRPACVEREAKIEPSRLPRDFVTRHHGDVSYVMKDEKDYSRPHYKRLSFSLNKKWNRMLNAKKVNQRPLRERCVQCDAFDCPEPAFPISECKEPLLALIRKHPENYIVNDIVKRNGNCFYKEFLFNYMEKLLANVHKHPGHYVIEEMLKILSQHYVLRLPPGDGSCFYRSFLFTNMVNFGKTLDYSHSEPTHPVEHVATAREVSLRESYFSNPDKFFTSIVSVKASYTFPSSDMGFKDVVNDPEPPFPPPFSKCLSCRKTTASYHVRCCDTAVCNTCACLCGNMHKMALPKVKLQGTDLFLWNHFQFPRFPHALVSASRAKGILRYSFAAVGQIAYQTEMQSIQVETYCFETNK